jgi:DtxR family Mn-dependent transcriptional regulator
MATPVAEAYLETIYNMTMEGDRVLGVRLAEKFGVSRATVTEMIKRLVNEGLVTQDRRRGVQLTEEGVVITEGLLRRHRLAERLLFDVLGLDWVSAHEQAHVLEHWISPEVEERISRFLGFPRTCPHGNPIPGNAPGGMTYLQQQGAFRLSRASADQTVRVLSISEVVEDESELLRRLMERGIVPEREIEVTKSGEAHGFVQYRADSKTHSLPLKLAEKIWVVARPMEGEER